MGWNAYGNKYRKDEMEQTNKQIKYALIALAIVECIVLAVGVYYKYFRGV